MAAETITPGATATENWTNTRPPNPPLPSRNETQTPRATAVRPTALAVPRKTNAGSASVSNQVHPDSVARDRRSFTRDPHKLLVYLIPFPDSKQTHISSSDEVFQAPRRYLLYTPGLPRKKKSLNDMPSRSISSKARGTRRIKRYKDFMSSDGKFLKRASKTVKKSQRRSRTEVNVYGAVPTPEEIVIFYPSSLQTSPEAIKQEFISTIARIKHRSKKRAWTSIVLLPAIVVLDFGVMVGALFAPHLLWGILPLASALPADLFYTYRSTKRARRASRVLHGLQNSEMSNADTPRVTAVSSVEMNAMEAHLTSLCQQRKRSRAGLVLPKLKGPDDFDVTEAVAWSLSKVAGVATAADDEWEMWEFKEDLLKALQAGANQWDIYDAYVELQSSRV